MHADNSSVCICSLKSSTMRRQITIAYSILSITSIFTFPSTYRSLRSMKPAIIDLHKAAIIHQETNQNMIYI